MGDINNMKIPVRTLTHTQMHARTTHARTARTHTHTHTHTQCTVNYDYIVTNSINSLLIGSRCIPMAHTLTIVEPIWPILQIYSTVRSFEGWLHHEYVYSIGNNHINVMGVPLINLPPIPKRGHYCHT